MTTRTLIEKGMTWNQRDRFYDLINSGMDKKNAYDRVMIEEG
jgi:hypothetical protein